MHYQTHSRPRHPLRFVTRIAALIVCFLTSQGCSDLLKQPYPAKAYFGIETGTPDAAAPTTESTAPADHQPSGPVVLVRAVRVSPPYDGLPLIHQVGPAQYSADYYVNWIAAPSALLTGDLTNWLEAVGVTPIVGSGSAVRPGFILESEVSRLVIDRTDPTKPHAEIAARFFLIRQDAANTTLDFEYADSADVAVQHDAPDEDAAAYGKAYRQILERLTDRIRSTLAAQ